MPFKDDVIEIVTPERVNLDFPIAGIGSRFVAASIDLIVVGALYFLVDLLFMPLSKGAFLESEYLKSIAGGIKIAIHFLVTFGYFVWFEYLWNGQTPGKRMMKLRVMRYGGLPVDFATVLIRNLMRIVDAILFAIAVGFLVLFLSKLSQRPGDYAAGTIVIKDRQVHLSDLEHYLHESVLEMKENEFFDRRFEKLGTEDMNLLNVFKAREEKMSEMQKGEIRKKIADSIRKKLNIKPDEFPSDEALIRSAMDSFERGRDNW